MRSFTWNQLVILFIGIILIASKHSNGKIINSSSVDVVVTSSIDNHSIYEDVDTHGNIMFTNKPSHSYAKKLVLPPLTIIKHPMTAQDLNIDSKKPHVDKYKDQTRLGRKYILQEELKKEVLELEEMMRTLTYNKNLPHALDNNKQKEQIKLIETAIREHQKNIVNLNNLINNQSK